MEIENLEKFKDMLRHFVPSDYSIGVHGITKGSDYEETAKLIIQSGLKNFNRKGILGNVKMFPQLINLGDDTIDKIFEYTYYVNDNGQIVNVLFAVPTEIKDVSGNVYFLGHYNEHENTHMAKDSDKAGANLPMTIFTDSIKLVPKEFIVGYCVTELNRSDLTFFPNQDFIGLKSEEEQQQFFEELLKQGLKTYAYTPEDAKSMMEEPWFEDFKHGNNEYWEQYKEYLKSKKDSNEKESF